ncbi:MAG: hypothetical protein ACRDQA_28940 [Nocardioidaceae bacterium]
MRPAVKYAAVGALYTTTAQGIWEHDLYQRLRGLYSRADLQALREDLVSMSTVGWLQIVEERDHRGQLLRKYALADHIRPFIRFQLRLDEVLAFLSGEDQTGLPSSTAADGSQP